jgi:hypothetical protein
VNYFHGYPPDDKIVETEIARSTNFGNAKRSTWGVPCAKASKSGSPSAGNADFVVTQTHFFLAWLGQRFFGCTAEPAGFSSASRNSSQISGPSNQGLGRSIFFGSPLGTDEARAEREKIQLSLARLP